MKNIRNIRHEETFGVCGELPEVSPLTDEETRRIKASVLKKITPYRRASHWVVSAAVVLVCLFTLIACSAELFQWNYRLSAILNLNDEQKTYAEKNQLVQNIEKASSAEQNGVKISLRQALADESVCYLIFDIALPENQVYLAKDAPIVEHFRIYGLSTFADPKTLTLPQDMSADNNTVSMYIAGFFEKDTYGRNIPVSVSFENLTYRTISETVKVEGKWDLSCTVNNNETEFLQSSINIPYEISAPEHETQTGTVTAFQITPLSLTLEYIWDNPDDETHDLFYSNPYDDFSLVIRYKNGEEVSLNSIDPEMNYIYSTGESRNLIICLDHLIDLQGIEEIVYNSITIPIE